VSLPIPYAITRQDDGVLIEWTEGAHLALYPARALRLACGCALCVDEMSGRGLLHSAAVPADIRPVSLSLVGTYGLRILWSDGHGTGIYTFERLLATCPCDRCLAERSAGTAPAVRAPPLLP
jgi:ATP-binding protein involved in chromosome partitioning